MYPAENKLLIFELTVIMNFKFFSNKHKSMQAIFLLIRNAFYEPYMFSRMKKNRNLTKSLRIITQRYLKVNKQLKNSYFSEFLIYESKIWTQMLKTVEKIYPFPLFASHQKNLY